MLIYRGYSRTLTVSLSSNPQNVDNLTRTRTPNKMRDFGRFL